jgi:membrane-bound serine protease (ClpP class)
MRRFTRPAGLLALALVAFSAARGGMAQISPARPEATTGPSTAPSTIPSAAATGATGATTASAPALSSASQPASAPAGARFTDEGWFAPSKATRPPLPKEITRAFVIPIREPITEKTLDAMERKVKRCRQSGAELVILDMDTWGGQVIAALDISRLLKENLADTYTVCYVRTRAVSAGALIALACNEIVMTPVGKLGDCAPILSTGEKLEGREREKIETVLRTEFSESADRDGYSNALAESMVSAYEVWLVRNKTTRELQYVLAKEWRGRVAVSGGVTTAPSNPASDWELVKVVLGDGELLTMKTADAVQYGFVRNVVKLSNEHPYEAIQDLYHIQGEPTVLSDNWSETMVEFLTSTYVSAFLFFVAIVCGYIEINVPGHIVPGIISVLCLALYFGSRYLTGMANWWAIALFAVGVLLVLLEIFVLTGFGVPGVLGIIICIVGLVAMLLPYRPGPIPLPKSPMDWSLFTNGVFGLGVAFVCAMVAVFALASYLPKLPLANKLVLAPVTTAPDSALTGTSPLLRVQPGDVGVVESLCRPVGKARFGEDLLDVTTEGGIVEPPAQVRVLRREGSRLVVEQV